MIREIERPLCIDAEEGHLAECPATWLCCDESGTTHLDTFRIGAFTGTRENAIDMMGRTPVESQEADTSRWFAQNADQIEADDYANAREYCEVAA